MVPDNETNEETLDQFLRNIATNLSVGPVEIDEVIVNWRKALGNFCRNVKVLRTLVSYPSDWGNIELDQVVKTHIKDALFPKTQVSRVVKFSWSDMLNVQKVEIIGSWNGWNEENPPLLKRCEGEWKCFVCLFPGTYEFRFKVDDEWKTSQNLAVSTSNSRNNTIEVHPDLLYLPHYTQRSHLERVKFNLSAIPLQFQTEGLFMAVDLAGQLLCDPKVAQQYCFQDRDNMESDDPMNYSEIQQVFNHFQQNELTLSTADTGKDFGATPANLTNPTMLLNQYLVGCANRQMGTPQFTRAVLLLLVTILHEVSHWKVRLFKIKQSPDKLFKESGYYVEHQLFGGRILPSIDFDQACTFLNIPLTFRGENGVEYFINDEWIGTMCANLIAGYQMNFEKLNFKNSLMVPRRIAPTQPFYSCQLARIREVEKSKGISTTEQ